MAKDDEISEPQPSQENEETQGTETQPSIFRRAANRVGQGVDRAGREIGQASRSTGQALQRSSEVLTGADIRRFDEFTEAVTRVAVGLHHDQAEASQRLAGLEQECSNLRQLHVELAERVARLEQERNRGDSGGFFQRIWRALFG